MKEKYKIIYLPLFYDDLKKIVKYIKYKLMNETAAKNFIDELEESINKIAYNPESYEKYISTIKRKTTYYRIYVKNYIVFYTVKDDVMEVRRIIFNKRNIKKLL